MVTIDKKKLRPDVAENATWVEEEMSKAIKKAVMKRLLSFQFRQLQKMKVAFKRIFAEHERLMEERSVSKNAEPFTIDHGVYVYLMKLQREITEMMCGCIMKLKPPQAGTKFKRELAGGVPAVWTVPPGELRRGVLLYFHGGAFVMMSPKTHRPLTAAIAARSRMKVLSIDYRLAPEHSFPAALEDCVSAYQWLLDSEHNAESIAIGGDSAGGTLTLATLLKLKQDGIKLPAGAICISPLTDWTLSGDSYYENATTDPVVANLPVFLYGRSYVEGESLTNPLVSPLFGDFAGLPPTLFQVSKAEMLHSDSVRVVKAMKDANVDVTLQEFEGMMHVFQLVSQAAGIPEADEAIENIAAFLVKIIE